MTIQLFAQPYTADANGFYFRSIEEYQHKVAQVKNSFGDPVEEFEIQFIDGEDIDAALADALDINQANLNSFFAMVEEWEEYEKIRFILAVGECGYTFDPSKDDINQLDVDIYYVESMRELAEEFVDEGLFGEIPKNIIHYLDYDAIARDLSVDYTQTTIAGTRIVYRCG